jgi:hypothetical protein
VVEPEAVEVRLQTSAEELQVQVTGAAETAEAAERAAETAELEIPETYLVQEAVVVADATLQLTRLHQEEPAGLGSQDN